MKATIIKLQKKPSRYGGFFFYCFFKGDDGDSYYTCLYPKMRNFSRWKKILKVGTRLSGLKLVNKRLVDADSRFVVVKEDNDENDKK